MVQQKTKADRLTSRSRWRVSRFCGRTGGAAAGMTVLRAGGTAFASSSCSGAGGAGGGISTIGENGILA